MSHYLRGYFHAAGHWIDVDSVEFAAEDNSWTPLSTPEDYRPPIVIALTSGREVHTDESLTEVLDKINIARRDRDDG